MAGVKVVVRNIFCRRKWTGHMWSLVALEIGSRMRQRSLNRYNYKDQRQSQKVSPKQMMILMSIASAGHEVQALWKTREHESVDHFLNTDHAYFLHGEPLG